MVQIIKHLTLAAVLVAPAIAAPIFHSGLGESNEVRSYIPEDLKVREPTLIAFDDELEVREPNVAFDDELVEARDDDALDLRERIDLIEARDLLDKLSDLYSSRE